MSRPPPLTHSQDPNLPPRAARVTRSTSHLKKEVIPTSEDHDMEDELILHPLPSSQSRTRALTEEALKRMGRESPNTERDRVAERLESEEEDPPLDECLQRELERRGLATRAELLEAFRAENLEMDQEPEPNEEKMNENIQQLMREHGVSTHAELLESIQAQAYGNAQETEEYEERMRNEEMLDAEQESELDDEEDDDGVEEDGNGDASSDDSALGHPRSEGEMRQIADEMDQVETSVPEIVDRYRLVDRLGEGTFSSVYKAVDLQHEQYHNDGWQPKIPAPGQVYVALKRIYVTSSPVRIHNELEILYELRGASNVAHLIDAIRHEDQVLAVMPYSRHQDFRSYYRKATLPMLRSYFSCLFRALAATHKLQIIHRDVKPANFLYDCTTGQGVLCDYGLAQKIGGDEFYEWKSECLHSLPGPSWGGLEGRRKAQRMMEKTPGRVPGLLSGLHGVRMLRPLSLWEQTSQMGQEWEEMENEFYEREDIEPGYETEEWKRVQDQKPWIVPPGWVDDIEGRMKERQAFYKGWRPAKFGSNMAGSQRVGHLKEERRPSVRANRAGTRGFRAPEVLLKCPDQTVALDIWSAGIILLCFLTRRFPFFNSNDDTEALAEIAAIFGKRKMERCAYIHNRTFVSNVPNLENPPHANFHALVKSLNPPIVVENSPDPFGHCPTTAEEDAVWYEDSDLFQAVDLMKRCLELDCTKRWTAEECLEHPFFEGLYDLGLGRTEHREDGHKPE